VEAHKKFHFHPTSRGLAEMQHSSYPITNGEDEMMNSEFTVNLDEFEQDCAAAAAQLVAANKRKAEAILKNRAGAIALVQEWIERFGIGPGEVTLMAEVKAKAVPRYIDLENGKKWFGSGKAPLWTVGKDLTQYLNPEWVEKQKAKEAKKQAKSVKDAEKKEKAAELATASQQVAASSDTDQVTSAVANMVEATISIEANPTIAASSSTIVVEPALEFSTSMNSGAVPTNHIVAAMPAGTADSASPPVYVAPSIEPTAIPIAETACSVA